MLSPSEIPEPRFKLWQHITVNRRPAVIVGSYYLSPTTALKIDADCWGWQYMVDYLEAMSIDEALTCLGNIVEIIDETSLLEGGNSNDPATVTLEIGDLEAAIEKLKTSIEWQALALSGKIRVILRERLEVQHASN